MKFLIFLYVKWCFTFFFIYKTPFEIASSDEIKDLITAKLNENTVSI